MISHTRTICSKKKIQEKLKKKGLALLDIVKLSFTQNKLKASTSVEFFGILYSSITIKFYEKRQNSQWHGVHR